MKPLNNNYNQNNLNYNQNDVFILDVYVGINVGCIWMYLIILCIVFYVTSLHMKAGLMK